MPFLFEAMASPSSHSDESTYENIMFVSKGLVHSSNPKEVRRGIAMLEGSIITTASSLCEQKDKLYLIAVGYFRIREYSMSMHYLKQCLEIDPLWKEALTLKKKIEGLQGNGATAAATAAATAVGGAAVRGTLRFAYSAAQGAVIALAVGIFVTEVRKNRLLMWRIESFFRRFS